MEQEKKEKKISLTKESAYAVLAYLWVLCLVPILFKKKTSSCTSMLVRG